MMSQENKGLQLALATDSHIEALLKLQEAFHKYSPPEKSEYTFAYEVTNDPFTEEDFRKIINRNEVVILANGDIPVGYMLIDTCSGTNGLKQFKDSVEKLITADFLDLEVKQMPRFMEALNPQLYQREFDEVRWQMLTTLIHYNRNKYKGLCYVFFTSTDILFQKLNLGWKIAFDNGIYYYLVWEFSQLDNNQ